MTGSKQTIDLASSYQNLQNLNARSNSIASIKAKQIDECFPSNINRLAFGNIAKAFCKPMNFKYFTGKFNNKSEEARYQKISGEILKLRHLLVNDPPSSHEYIFKFLKQFFDLQEISQFTDEGLKNFIHAILEFKVINPNLSMRQNILQAMNMNQSNYQQSPEYKIEDGESSIGFNQINQTNQQSTKFNSKRNSHSFALSHLEQQLKNHMELNSVSIDEPELTSPNKTLLKKPKERGRHFTSTNKNSQMNPSQSTKAKFNSTARPLQETLIN